MKMSEAFPSKYINAADLGERSHPVIIANVEMETLGEDRKPVLYFQGRKKGLALNKTNGGRIALLYGDDTDDWIGKEITLVAAEVDFKGDTVMAVRIKPPPRRDGSVKAPVGNGSPPKGGQHVVTDKGGYAISEMKPGLPPDGDPIPF